MRGLYRSLSEEYKKDIRAWPMSVTRVLLPLESFFLGVAYNPLSKAIQKSTLRP